MSYIDELRAALRVMKGCLDTCASVEHCMRCADGMVADPCKVAARLLSREVPEPLPCGHPAAREELQKQHSEALNALYATKLAREDATKRAEKAEAALAWYANEDNYRDTFIDADGRGMHSAMVADGGSRAREALGENDD